MAARMGAFLEGAQTVSCVSGHVYDDADPHACDLCQSTHATELLVVKNRANKKMLIGLSCLKEMVRFKVVDVDELPRWLEKLSELRKEHERRKIEREEQRKEERKRLEKKVIVRRKVDATT